MKKYFLLILFKCVLLFVNAQTSGWNNLSLGHFSAVTFVDSKTGFAVGTGQNSAIYKTVDGGFTWDVKMKSEYLGDIDFLDKKTGFVLGTFGKILKTIDGGENWISVNSGTIEMLTSVKFIDSNVGFIVGDLGTILRTTDGGTTWIKKDSKTTKYLNSIDIIDDNIAFAVGENGTIIRTIDGGTNWNLLTSGVNDWLFSVEFTDINTGYVTGRNGTILKTINGGVNWTKQKSNSIYDIKSICFTNTNTGFAIAYNNILKTNDGGTTWTTLVNSNNAELNCIFFIDAITGYIVGSFGTILQTENSGISWITKYARPFDMIISSIDFTDKNTGYCVGNSSSFSSDSKILKTIDGGKSWTEIFKESSWSRYFSVCFPNSLVGYVVGDKQTKGIILKTIDDGVNWVAQSIGTTDFLLSVYFVDINTGYAVGGNGTILKTINGGIDWIKQNSGTTNRLNSVFFLDANIGFAVGDPEVIIKTVDGGINWTVLRNIKSSKNALMSVCIVDENIGFAVGKHGIILKTTNGGSTWESQVGGITTGDLNSVHFTDTRMGYIACADGILQTIDGGINWTLQNIETSNGLSSISFIDSNIGYIAGGSTVIKTNRGGGTTLAVSTNNLVIPSSSTYTSGFTITSNSIWNIVSNQEWLKFDKQSGENNSTIILNSSTNPSAQKRTATITVSSEGVKPLSIEVTQEGAPLVSSYSLTLSEFENSSASFDIINNQGLTWGSHIDGKWLKISQNTGEGNTTITVTAISDNLMAEPRWASIYISGVSGVTTNKIAVLQKGQLPFFKILNKNISVDEAGMLSSSLSIESNAYWEVKSNVDWLKITPSYGTGNGILLISATSPNLILPRNATFTISVTGLKSETVTVTQDVLKWTWKNPLSITKDFLSVDFVDHSTGYAVGSGGTIIKIIEGEYWSAQNSGIIDDLNSVNFIDINTGYTVGNNGRILKTTSGGLSWYVLTSITTNNLFSVNFPSPNIGYIVGNNGTILKSVNGGLNWTSLNSGVTSSLKCVFFIDNNTGFACGHGGTILKTENGGTNWTICYKSNLGGDLNSVFFIDRDKGYVVGQNATILKTNDGGSTWIPINSGLEYSYLYSVSFIDSRTGFIVGNNGLILKTTDGGIKWTAQSSGTYNDLKCINFPTTNIGYIVGRFGTILKTEISVFTTIDNKSIDNNQVIYPNPANNYLFIKGFDDMKRISICDINGKIIIDKEMIDNQIDISILKSGLYILRCETLSGTVIKKFEKQ